MNDRGQYQVEIDKQIQRNMRTGMVVQRWTRKNGNGNGRTEKD